ncbi:MAG: DUF4198 domain-containing protein [Desulfobacteraceae bacterium]|nr:MAG: DUF4198 domain-containing protein [Desulfobacteraceae bacterium]
MIIKILLTKIGIRTLVLLFTLLVVAPALAHFPWISVPDHTLDPGRSTKVRVGWGHIFPLDDFLDTADVDFLHITGPDGNTRKLSPAGDQTYTALEMDKPGVYYITGRRKPGFFTIREKGFKIGPKTGVKDAVKCSYSVDNMKAILQVGDEKANADKVFGFPLELVPLTSPSEIKVGDYMKIQVLHKSKPVHHFKAYATYEGFSNDGAFAYTNGVDSKGIFNLKILHSGKWVVYAEIDEPYENPAECDLKAYRTSLTFEIR